MSADSQQAIRCTAKLYHGNGHQSSTACHVEGPHEIHEANYWHANSGYEMVARWRDGEYTGSLRTKGIDFDPESYPENLGMTGFFDEPPQGDEEADAETGERP